MSTETSHPVVLISGNFNVIHAGHIRLFALAKQLGKRLIVGVYSDRSAGGGVFIDESFRVEALRTSGWADQVILIETPLEAFIRELRPDIVVKGREFEHQDNVEAAVLAEYGGQLIFGSSELPLGNQYDAVRNLITQLTACRPFEALHTATRDKQWSN